VSPFGCRYTETAAGPCEVLPHFSGPLNGLTTLHHPPLLASPKPGDDFAEHVCVAVLRCQDWRQYELYFCIRRPDQPLSDILF